MIVCDWCKKPITKDTIYDMKILNINDEFHFHGLCAMELESFLRNRTNKLQESISGIKIPPIDVKGKKIELDNLLYD